MTAPGSRPPRHLLRADEAAAAHALADAFADDPVWGFVFGGLGRLDELTRFFEVCLRAGRRRGHTYLDVEGHGVALWAPPDVGVLDRREAEEVAALVDGLHGAAGLARFGQLTEATAAHHPRYPHFYLFILGVARPAQGRGLGGVLVDPVLDVCDREGLPAYLESSNPRNVPFYERLGFEVVSEILVEGGPSLQAMSRPPGAARTSTRRA